MKKLLSHFLIWGTVIFVPATCLSQYILNGNAIEDSCNCYTLTQPINSQVGSVWQNKEINLNDSFDFSFRVFLGCDTSGADGIAFILQTLSTSIGSLGQGWGYGGISPSIGISLDTYPNSGDPAYDNIAIHSNGSFSNSNDLAGPIAASTTSNNIKDCEWHTLRITWNPSTFTLSTYFDGIFRLSTQINMVSTIFNNNPMVYWGFSGGTGGSVNLQKFCTPLNSVAITGLADNTTCFGNPIIFRDSSLSFTTIQDYYWNFGDGTTSTSENSPHLYTQPGIYTVSHTITAEDGCLSPPDTEMITVADNPTLSLNVFDTCQDLLPRIDTNVSLNFGNINQWEWTLDGVDSSSSQNPNFSNLLPGNHSILLTITSNFGCKSNTATSDFNIKPTPAITFNPNSGCVNTPIIFSAQQTDNITTINNWHWNFGDNDSSNQKNTQHIYSVEGNYNVQLSAEATDGCTTTIAENVLANQAHANAGNDTVVLPNSLFQLHGSGGVSYTWSPTTGLSNPDISNPTGSINESQTYLLNVATAEGCNDTASVTVTIFKGSAIYVPTAFTPNGDGLNDIISPYLIGIKTLYYFTIYNRWGRQVFSTNEMNKGWDGNLRGQPSNPGVYAWMLEAVDEIGKVYKLRGSFVLIR